MEAKRKSLWIALAAILGIVIAAIAAVRLVLTPEKLEVLEKYAFRNGRTVFFAHAPGICDGRSLDPERVQVLTGAAFKTPGVSTVQRDGWKAVYVPGYEDLTPQVLRQAALDAGVTIVCQDPVPVYANDRLVAIHVAQGGGGVVEGAGIPRPAAVVGHAEASRRGLGRHVVPVLGEGKGG